MFGIPLEQFVPIAQFLGAALVGLLAAFGLRYGQSRPTPAEKTLEVAGALIDSKAVDRLSTAIEAHTKETIAGRKDSERLREIGYKLCDALTAVTGEIEELRREVKDAAREVSRLK